MDNEQLVTSIKAFCKIYDITVTRLEEVLGMSQGLISRWSKSDPSLSKIIDIANYFKISIDTLINPTQILNDKFLYKLLSETINKNLIWHSYNTQTDSPQQYHDEKADEYYIKLRQSPVELSKGEETSFYTCINSGYVSLYSFHEKNNTKKNATIKLFIQANPQAQLIDQKYSLEQLKELWIKVLFSLYEEAPDDIKAEELKLAFISENTDNFNRKESNSSINIISNHSSFIESLEIIKTPEFQQMQKLFSNPEFQKAIEIAQKAIRDQ